MILWSSKTVRNMNQQRSAIITGGSRGLGRNTAVHLARRGVDVIFTYHSNQTEAESLRAKSKRWDKKRRHSVSTPAISARSIDSSTTYAKTLQSWGRERFDYLVNNAGNSLHEPFEQTTEAEFDAIVNVHFKGVYFLTQKTSSADERWRPDREYFVGLARFCLPGTSAYGAAKGAIEVLTRYLAKELGPRGITANVVAPGAIQTDFSGGMVRDNPEINKRVAEMTALGRAGVPDDIGPMIAALLSDENRWVNGQRIEVSGGMAL